VQKPHDGTIKRIGPNWTWPGSAQPISVFGSQSQDKRREAYYFIVWDTASVI